MLTTNHILHQGRYRIVSQLGQNGSEISYKAQDKTTDAKVILSEIRESAGKVVTPSQLEARQNAFAAKAKPLTLIKHESILSIIDFFSDIDHHYLVTDFVEGFTLGELLEKKKSAFPLTDVGNWADSLLDALNYLHTQTPSYVHSEIRPQNIKLLPGGKIKLLIFNLIKPENEKLNAASGNQTFDAAVLPYLPLEQIWEGLDAASKKVILTDYDEKSEKILEQPLDARSDIYSVAAVLYYLLTARPPVDALTRSIDLLEGKPDPLVSPSRINQLVPAQISNVLMNALEIKRENRFSSAAIMRQVLRTAYARAKEIEAAGKKGISEEDSVLEIPLSEQRPATPKPATKSAEMESEQARQLELIKNQLREAETRRLEAERRAAEAEKRLLEAEKHTSVDPSAEKSKTLEAKEETETSAPIVPLQESTATPDSQYQADEFSSLFSEQPKESSVFKKAAAAIVIFLFLGGAGFGIWKFARPNSVQSVQSAATNQALPEPTVGNTPVPVTENAPAPSNPTITAENVEPAETTSSSNPASVKSKPVTSTPVPQTAQTKKSAPTPAKEKEAPKKVTLDDLLKDN